MEEENYKYFVIDLENFWEDNKMIPIFQISICWDRYEGKVLRIYTCFFGFGVTISIGKGA